ncbi:NAD+ synthase [Aurantivibrio plasticivorans]
MATLTLVLAQINPLVGDIPGNSQQVIDMTRRAVDEYEADLVVFPELTLMGYPPEDLLLRDSVEKRVSAGLEKIANENLPASIVVGYPAVTSQGVYNAAGVLQKDGEPAQARKQCLPNYQVFDDKRYFTAGLETTVVDIQGIRVAVLVCEDIWQPEPSAKAKALGAELIVVLNASPFEIHKFDQRREVLLARYQETGLPIVYVNQVGGQDELVFDGGSLVIDQQGEFVCQAPSFETGLYPIKVQRVESGVRVSGGVLTEPLPNLAKVYQALVLGTRDYIEKNGFKGVVLGLSGGIDSALVLAIAVDALGKDRVEAVMMPFRYTSQMSQDDAAEEAQRLGVRYQSIAIEPIVNAFQAALANEFDGLPVDKTEENIQARTRGNLLMAISNKKGYLVLTTGNKSEMAVGYATLYGDMAGGFDPLKDVAKTLVFELAKYRNTLSEVIPVRVIERPPSAELAPDQIDEDSLPPYSVLDKILALYIEEDQSAEDIISLGYDRHDVQHVLRLVDINEYKRRQAAIGPRITKRGFGRDRRYPITSGWKIGD